MAMAARSPRESADKIKFVCRWGVDAVFEGGETRLCTVPRSFTFPQLVAKLRELTG